MSRTLTTLTALVAIAFATSSCGSTETDESRCAPVVEHYAALVQGGGHSVTAEQRESYLDQCVEMDLDDAQRRCVLAADSVGDLSQCNLPRLPDTKIVGPRFRGTR